MSRPPVVLMYHGLGTVPAELDRPNNFVPVDAFVAQLDRLVARGFTVIDEETYLTILDGGPGPSHPVLLTFDDGLVSVLEDAAPVLASRGMPAVCYVSPGLLGQQPGPDDHDLLELLDADGYRELQDAGVTIGCHSWGHDAMAGMDAPVLAQATAEARAEVERLVGRVPRTFAYPYGIHDEAARQAVQRAGFEAAFATYEGTGRYAVTRVDVNATDTPRSFDLKLTRIYPATRRALALAPGVRRLAHRMVGHAERA